MPNPLSEGFTHPAVQLGRAGRPRLPEGKARVVLPAQRVAPETLEYLQKEGRRYGGIGKAIDKLAKVGKLI